MRLTTCADKYYAEPYFVDPCIGYIIRERFDLHPDAYSGEDVPYTVTPRSLVILGDTSDPTALIPLVKENPQTSVSLLIHEATDAYIPPDVDPERRTGKNRTNQSVTEKAIAKGHSTPAMAGLFANQIGAERLALNHIGARWVMDMLRHRIIFRTYIGSLPHLATHDPRGMFFGAHVWQNWKHKRIAHGNLRKDLELSLCPTMTESLSHQIYPL